MGMPHSANGRLGNALRTRFSPLGMELVLVQLHGELFRLAARDPAGDDESQRGDPMQQGRHSRLQALVRFPTRSNRME